MKLRVGLVIISLWVLVSLPSKARAIEEVRITSTGPGVNTLPLEIAARKGFFVMKAWMSDHYHESNIAVNALLNRGVDYATPVTSMIKASTAGLPIKNFCGTS